MTAATLVLIAPCSLLLGAVLQILVARLCSARTKGILASLACLPAVLAVIGAGMGRRFGQDRPSKSICCTGMGHWPWFSTWTRSASFLL